MKVFWLSLAPDDDMNLPQGNYLFFIHKLQVIAKSEAIQSDPLEIASLLFSRSQ